MRFHSSCLFHTGQPLLVDFGFCAPTRLVFFDTGQSLLVDFDLCAPTRLAFITLVSHCWWNLACALPLVLSFFFNIGPSLLADFGVCAPTRLFFFDTGQSLLVDFCLCASTRLVFFTLVSRCWRGLTWALPLALSFSH